MAETPEGKVKKAIKLLLTDIGAWFYMPVQNGMGRTGIPDFVCCINGTMVGIEAKAPGKKSTLTNNQQIELDGIAKAGGVAIVAETPYEVTVALISHKLLPPNGAPHVTGLLAK